MSVIEQAREAAQDRGSKLGHLSNKGDAYALGEAGLAALIVLLEHLIAYQDSVPAYGMSPELRQLLDEARR